MQLNSYDTVRYLFSKARNKDKGKPVGSNWRVFQDGDEYALYCHGTMFGRFLPDNTFRFCYTGQNQYMPPAVYTMHKIMPVMMVRRSKGHYRVHVKDRTTQFYPPTDGFKLYDGMVLDLTTRLMVRYTEPKLVVDAAARTKWLRQLRATKRHLHTIAKLGGFTVMIEPMKHMARWEAGVNFLRARSSDLHIISQALDGYDMPVFVEMVAQSMYANIYDRDDIPAQRQHINDIFNNNSFELRRLRGVVEYK